jgi:uncharacterized BrkB/YihY/UPF0761 family membrane protein
MSGSSSGSAKGSAKGRPVYKTNGIQQYKQQLNRYYDNKSPPIAKKMTMSDMALILFLLVGVIAIIFAYIIPAFKKASYFTVNDDELKSKYHNKLT